MAVLTDGELRLLLAAIEERTGIHHRPDQVDAIGKTIEDVMRESGIERTDQFLVALDRDDSVFNRLVDAITIGETYFFREPKHFDYLREELIPEFRQRYGEESRLRAWSAACSSGEEAYSLAILCHELNQPVDILATDIAPESIAEAGLATYRDWSFRGESLRRVRPYLIPGGPENERTLKPSVRRLVRFRLLNLVVDDYPETKHGTSYLNLIFCRNVLIYFDPDTSRKIAANLVQCLAPGGCLITASTDLSLADIPGVRSVTNDWGTFYRKEDGSDSETTPTTGGLSSENFLAPLSPTLRGGEGLGERGPIARKPRALETNPMRSPSPPAPLPEAGRGEPGAFQGSSISQQLRSLRQVDLPTALAAVARLAESHPLELELHYQHGRLLMESDQPGEAAKALQRALFLDQTAIMPHFLFGTIQMGRRQWASAGRHLNTARQLCEPLSPDQTVPLSDAMTVAETIPAIDSQLAKLQNPTG